MKNVAVVGASNKEERYSNRAMKLLEKKGHNPIPVAPARDQILGRKVYPNLAAVPDQIDTVTMYVGVDRQARILEDVIHIKPRRIIFNPGTENPEAYDRLREAGIEIMEACTLVLLNSGQF